MQVKPFLRDLSRVNRQEKQIKYGHALIAFMLYFISDALWAEDKMYAGKEKHKAHRL